MKLGQGRPDRNTRATAAVWSFASPWLLVMVMSLFRPVSADEPTIPPPLPDPLPSPVPAPHPSDDRSDADTNAQLLRRLEQLEREVGEVQQLRQRVQDLEAELKALKSGTQPPTPSASPPASSSSSASSTSNRMEPGRSIHSIFGGTSTRSSDGGLGNGSSGESDPTAGYTGENSQGSISFSGGGGAGPNTGGTDPAQSSIGRGERVGRRTPLGEKINVEYKYNFAGGYFQFSDKDGEFVLNVQNILTLDGTFHDRQNAPTRQQGFNIPFQRLYLYGNVTKNWEYQVSEQSTLGNFNLLDMIINVHYDDRLMLKFGRFLAPFYYQDYATFPMLVPTVSYSPLVQFSAQREPGAMAWGKLFQNRMQYQAGVFTGIPDSYFDLDRNLDFVGALTLTPFMPTNVESLQNLGFGVSTQVGWQDYLLDRGEILNFIPGGGTPNLNQRYVTATGVPFFIYNDNVRALGERVRIAPHFFRYGRFSVLGEYVLQTRELADPSRRGTSVQHGFYVTTSYFLTGEENTGDGTGGFPTIIPNRPLNPSRGEYGPGAWELATQFTQLNVGTGDIQRGFADPIWATRLNELILGVNWWPNKYVRASFDWVIDDFNQPIPWPVYGESQTDNPTNPISRFNVFWTRLAIFY